MSDDLERAVDRATALSPELREAGRKELEELYRSGSVVAGVELARLVVGEGLVCSLDRAEAVRLLIREVRLSQDPSAFWCIYYAGPEAPPDELIEELLVLVAPNSGEAQEILDARLPGWRHPLA